MLNYVGPQREAPGWSGGTGSEGEMRERRGKLNSFRNGYFENVSIFWGIEAVSSCIKPGPGVIREGE